MSRIIPALGLVAVLTASCGGNAGVDGDRPVAAADAGATDTGTVELSAGTCTVHCGVPGHREGGMEAALEVS